MGKALSTLRKPIRDFNVEARAHKVISQPKPKPAPKHKSDEASYQELLSQQPEAFRRAMVKDEALDKRLKDVFLRSHDPMVKNESQGLSSPERPLPIARTFVDSGEYGFHEPKRVPYGRVTLRSVFKFLGEHHIDSKTFTATKIAEDYLLPEETVKNILKYFKMYELYIPQQRDVKAKFAGPAIPRKKIQTSEPRLLDFKKKEKDIFND